MLAVSDLHAFYGKSHILQGVSLTVGEGDIVSSDIENATSSTKAQMMGQPIEIASGPPEFHAT